MEYAEWQSYIKHQTKSLSVIYTKNKNMEETQAKKNTYYKWNDLEDLVNKAIKEGKPYIVFKAIKTEEYKYIQKVAETRSSLLGVQPSAFYSVATFGFGLMTGLSFIDIKYLIGVIIIIPAILLLRKWRQKYDVCNEIILNAERKLLWMEIESKKSHSDTCHPPSNYSPAPESEENRSLK